MTPTNVIAVRDLIGKDKISIFGDNAKLYNEEDKGEKIIWDDENQNFYCVRLNTNNRTYDKQPVSFQSGGYDIIQYISASMTFEELEIVLKALQAKGLDIDIDTIIGDIKDVMTIKMS